MRKPDPERIYNVVLFGVTGCGKSSIINLLAGKPVANVSTGVEGCTTRARWYPISVGDKKFRLWDTMGFNQAEVKGANPLSPYEQAHALLRNLEDGVDLVVVCARKDGITASLRSIYWLLDSFFFGGRVQMALVFTHFDTPSKGWWNRNKQDIAKRCNIPVQFVSHACITTVQDGSPQSVSLYDESRQALAAMLQEYATPSTPTALRLDLSSDSALAEAAESLKTYCQLNLPYASTLTQKFSSPKRPFQAIFFGESGVGKSSVINLIVGKKVADVSNGVGGCTLDSRCHEINTGLNQFVVWDTVGFNEPHIDHTMCGKAIENAVRLVRDLHRRGGVDLLVFCKKGGRATGSEVNNFRLFYEFLCPGQVPVAFVITQLEHENPMEGWWEKYGDDLVRTFRLKMSAVAGHACITSLASDNPDTSLSEKLSSSRQSVQTMLEDMISYGSAFSWDEGTWVMHFLRILVGMVRVGNPQRKEKITVKNLVDRCGLSKEQADELVKLLYMRG